MGVERLLSCLIAMISFLRSEMAEQPRSPLGGLDLDTAIRLRWALRDIKAKRTKLSPDKFLKPGPSSGGKADMPGGPSRVIRDLPPLNCDVSFSLTSGHAPGRRLRANR